MLLAGALTRGRPRLERLRLRWSPLRTAPRGKRRRHSVRAQLSATVDLLGWASVVRDLDEALARDAELARLTDRRALDAQLSVVAARPVATSALRGS